MYFPPYSLANNCFELAASVLFVLGSVLRCPASTNTIETLGLSLSFRGLQVSCNT